ncbi:MAG: hypothetical protein PHS78_09700 [Aliarcobacter skirrowii]|uniref:hypothetical protein n=1 Tax=Aliarcobacter skirrowii TaxID=28200 RepID=UPI002431A02E|nr:hypothetical protein [Aliarcobacter skirrowii]MDD2509294.1 hypothetical protein [Aliarcobacter skirrowii]MDD3497747.1 hypothetical protein [Aliarcobacter skirrowii]
MYILNKTPIFLEFLKRFMNKAGYVFKDEIIQNRLFLHSKCNCGQKDCATVYLKSKKPFKEDATGINIFNTNKGYIIVHILDCSSRFIRTGCRIDSDSFKVEIF